MALSTHDELLLLRKRARRRLVGAIVMVSLSTAVLWNVVDALPEQAMKPEAVDITGLQAASQPAAVVAPPPPPAVASQPVTDLLATLPPDEPEAASQPAVKPPVVLAKPPVAPPVPAVIAPAPAVAPIAKPEVKPETKPLPKPELPVEPKPQAKPKAEVKAEAKVEPKPVAKEPAKDSKPKPAAEKKAADPMAILEGRESAHAEPAKPAKDNAADASPSKKFSIQLAALSDPQKVDALRSRLAAAGVSARFSKVQTSKGEVTRVRVGPFKSREEADAAMRRLSKAGVTGIVVGAE